MSEATNVWRNPVTPYLLAAGITFCAWYAFDLNLEQTLVVLVALMFARGEP